MKTIRTIILLSLFCNFVQSQNYSDSLTIELTKHFESSNLPGFSVAIVNESGILYQQGFGYSNKVNKTIFKPMTIENLGSVSKTVVGLALVKAIEDGKLTMDTPINKLLPFEIKNPRFKNSPILIRHLANHTSTILDSKHYRKSYIKDDYLINEGDVNIDFKNFLKLHKEISLHDFLFNILNKKGKWYKKKNFLNVKPGKQKEYSNLNAALAAYIIELATGVPFEEYTKVKIFQPLNMVNTTWNTKGINKNNLATLYFPKGKVVPRYKLITYPDGGLYSNSIDLSKFLNEIILAYNAKSQYLPEEYARILLPGDEDNNRIFWGMGIKSRNIGHGGGDPGIQTDLQFNADYRIGRIILANVNAEDDEFLWKQYRKIHDIVAKYENRLIVK